MSGGSMDYLYSRIEEYADKLDDPEMQDMARDFARVCHDAEWWQSADSSEALYRKAVERFKRKWFGGGRDLRLSQYVEAELERARKKCAQIVGEGKKEEN